MSAEILQQNGSYQNKMRTLKRDFGLRSPFENHREFGLFFLSPLLLFLLIPFQMVSKATCPIVK